jgi:predicted nucleic acid-binding protein
MERFLDSNVFIYAFYRPKHRLSELEQKMKTLSKNIITDISLRKELVITTVVHLSEVANILKHSFSSQELGEVIHAIFDQAEVLGVTREKYLVANELARELDMDPNDALAYQTMKEKGLDEIYSFDLVFERIEGIKRLPAL